MPEEKDLVQEQSSAVADRNDDAESYIREAIEIRGGTARKVSYERAMCVDQFAGLIKNLWHKFLVSPAPLWIRWILFLPMLMLLGTIVEATGLLFVKLVSPLPNGGIILRYMSPIVLIIFSPIVCVLGGAKIAPKHKGTVLLILACFTIYRIVYQGIWMLMQASHRHLFSGTITYSPTCLVPFWWDMLIRCACLGVLIALIVQSRRLNSHESPLSRFLGK